MLIRNKILSVSPITTHIYKDVSKKLNKKFIIRKLQQNQNYKNLFNKKPLIRSWIKSSQRRV